MPEEIDPLYYEVPKKKVYFARAFGVITTIIVMLAVVFCLVQGQKKSTLYLCMINLLLSSIVALFLVWWYHKGVLEAGAYNFMIFLGICLIFQAIVTDIYVWHWKPMSSTTNADVIPHTMKPITHSSTTTRKPMM